MVSRVAMVCAGGLLVALVGCSFRLGNNASVQVDVKANDQVVKGAIDGVAQKIENEMRRLGLQVAVTREAATVRLSSTTKAGQRFVVQLSRIGGPQGEQTSIHIDWDQASDRDLWLQLLLVAGQATVTGQ